MFTFHPKPLPLTREGLVVVLRTTLPIGRIHGGDGIASLDEVDGIASLDGRDYQMSNE